MLNASNVQIPQKSNPTPVARAKCLSSLFALMRFAYAKVPMAFQLRYFCSSLGHNRLRHCRIIALPAPFRQLSFRRPMAIKRCHIFVFGFSCPFWFCLSFPAANPFLCYWNANSKKLQCPKKQHFPLPFKIVKSR